MEPSLWTMLVSVLSHCPFTQDKGQKNSLKKNVQFSNYDFAYEDNFKNV